MVSQHEVHLLTTEEPISATRSVDLAIFWMCCDVGMRKATIVIEEELVVEEGEK
jgi:hypothetical protein